MGRQRSLTPRRCQIEGCGQKHYAIGYCRKHYQYYWRIGRKDRSPQAVKESDYQDADKWVAKPPEVGRDARAEEEHVESRRRSPELVNSLGKE